MSTELRRQYVEDGHVVKDTIILENVREEPDVEEGRRPAVVATTEEYVPLDERRRNLAWMCMGGVALIVILVLLVTLVPKEQEANSA